MKTVDRTHTWSACILAVFLVIWGVSPTRAADTSKTRIVIDNAGRRVEIPLTVNRIACLPGPSYEMVFMLGGKDQICQVRKDHKRAYPLANLTNPALKGYSSSLSNINPKARINIEEFIKLAPDVVIYYNVPHALKKFREARIPVYVYQPAKQTLDLDEIIEDQKRSFRSLADLIGGTAPGQAEKWCAYYEEVVSLIRSRTRDIPDTRRPRTYVGNSWGTNPLATWGDLAHTFSIHLCGGICVTKDIKGPRFPEVNLEQLIAWNPDVIIMDNHGREPDTLIRNIYEDSNWSVMSAVTNKRIHRIPSGVFFLDKGSSRPVYLLWLAKQLCPERFGDINMVQRIQYFFKTFYHFDLSEEDAGHALRGWDLLKG
ncbi:MAG: hypothetical protein D3926_18375 [Desulfobacteraceae bacterium]|nr:MAG: hypothetical protein D3926_18375 [Desulfobacteraceae bacterium]